MPEIKMTTPGEFIVTTIGGMIAVVSINGNGIFQKTIATLGNEDDEDANEHLANAALFAVSKDMLDLLIDVQQILINPDAEETDLLPIVQRISDVFAKLANEAGEEL